MIKISNTQAIDVNIQEDNITESKSHSMVDWWLRLGDITPEEHNLINKPCNYNHISTNEIHSWKTLQEKVRINLPYAGGFSQDEWDMNLFGYNLYLGKSATELIAKVFEKEVDDDTLIVTSVVEHPAVKNAIEKLNRTEKDHIILHYYNGIKELNISQVINACENKKYKKAFVMIIGTQITTGEVTPQKLFIKLKNYLESQGIKTVMAIDDCQGMYLVPRNYNIFDYVIYTAHTLVREHQMGMLWSKDECDFGNQYSGWLSQYLPKLKAMLKYQDKYNSFTTVMKDEFDEYLSKEYINEVTGGVPYIFSIRVECNPLLMYSKYDVDKWLEDYEVKLESDGKDWFYIRLRAAQYITTPEKLMQAIPNIKALLEKVITYKENL